VCVSKLYYCNFFYFSWGVKAASAHGRQPCRLICQLSRNPGSLKLLEPSGSVQHSTGQNFSIYYLSISKIEWVNYISRGMSVYMTWQ
jgi:hypothetical protein